MTEAATVQVYKAKIGGLEVAVKTINRQFLNPKISIQEALRVMQKVCLLIQLCSQVTQATP